MSFSVPLGWNQDTDKLYVHASHGRIQRMSYHSQESWVLIPPGDDSPVLQFPPTSEGRDMAFAAFVTGAFGPRDANKPAIDARFDRGEARMIGEGSNV